MLDRRVDEFQRRLEAFLARLLVPIVFELEIVLELPASRGIAGGEKGSEPAFGEELGPTVPRRRDVDQRGDAAFQQLAVGKLGAGRTKLIVGGIERLGA